MVINGIGGHSWDYGLYTDRSSDLGGSEYMLREQQVLQLSHYTSIKIQFLSMNFRQYQMENVRVYKDFYGHIKRIFLIIMIHLDLEL